jgi:hypothetical protein
VRHGHKLEYLILNHLRGGIKSKSSPFFAKKSPPPASLTDFKTSRRSANFAASASAAILAPIAHSVKHPRPGVLRLSAAIARIRRWADAYAQRTLGAGIAR